MKKQSDQRMTKLADAAFRRAAQKVIERAEDAGTPVIVWENEEVTELEPRKAQAGFRGTKTPVLEVSHTFPEG
jgi:hypothetical protein